jgi:hypothetical protein
VSVLERRFPPAEGYGTLFPKRKNGETADTGLIKAFATFYADSTLFLPTTNLLAWDKMPETFLKDRSAVCLSNIHSAHRLNTPLVASWCSYRSQSYGRKHSDFPEHPVKSPGNNFLYLNHPKPNIDMHT